MIIMVPVDGSHFSEQALPLALQIAERRHARLHIVRVRDTAMAAVVGQAPGYFSDSLDHEMHNLEMDYLKDVTERAKSFNDSPVSAFSVRGTVVEALATHASEHGVDLVVMTTHGRGGLSRAWLGSVADQLVRTVKIPMLLGRPVAYPSRYAGHLDEPNRVLIPLDGSRISETIIDEVRKFAVDSSVAITLLQVISPPVTASAEATLEFEVQVNAARREAEDYLDRQADVLRSLGYLVETRVVMQSNIAAAIVEESVESGCDMIAMATHGRSGLTRVALGSVTDKVLRTAPVPMLVMKPE